MLVGRVLAMRTLVKVETVILEAQEFRRRREVNGNIYKSFTANAEASFRTDIEADIGVTAHRGF